MPLKPRHKRSETWPCQPFPTLQSFADFADEVSGLITRAGSTPRELVSVYTEDRDYLELSMGDLRELSPTMSTESVQELKTELAWNSDDDAISVSFVLYADTRLDFGVNGSDQVRVDGIHAWVLRKIEQLRAESERLQREAAELTEQDSPAPTLGWFKRFINHPWTVQIGGGLLLLLGAAVVAWLTH